ncbi:serine/threonine-protein kinase [Streptomyces millisiae]|uniref:non-specific serine/threonine protein kinase n=1 Tax=Streptomyces millisiae TaxID=3075542 RepID=A0ABU2LXH7_9ACTN|nr:serine/threonine-protein kinase [Streptomyces sp. DSM 44918]MDT0322294.1 serine/threonine-protein kinase [Streptomyces sp. DSM 44918]
MRPVGSKYLLEEPLGRGATGTVYRGRQRESAGDEAAVAGQPGERVAIKVLKEELASDPDVVMRFLRERAVLLRLSGDNHQNIVRTRDLVVEGEMIALVMDLIDGPDLHRYLYENRRFSPVAAALLTAQIADALAAAHARGIVHRDLKPANVLLAGADDENVALRPMLTDFGIARLADSPGVTRASEFVGTPSYVAPESAEGRPQTSAVDVYAAGIVLYELVTGQPPFGGASTLEILRRHLSDEPRRPAGLPDPLWTVIDCCLRKSPDERPSAAALARALRTVAAGIAENASPEQRTAALGVAALLAPDTNPVLVPGTGISPPGSAEPTQVLPGGSASAGGSDPYGATSVLPQHGAGPDHGQGGGGRDDDLSATRAMPAQGAPPPEPQLPTAWGDQLRAARDRNEPTRVQPAEPALDPLQRAPQRRPQRRPQRVAPPPQQQGQGGAYGYPVAPPPQYQQPQQYQPQQYQQQPQRYQPPVPPRYQEPAPRRNDEPRGRSRSANPMRIPGLGCLKGCLFMVLILVVICFLVWNFTPLQDWIADGRSFWDTVTGWFDDVREWLGLIEEANQQVEDIQNSVPE